MHPPAPQSRSPCTQRTACGRQWAQSLPDTRRRLLAIRLGSVPASSSGRSRWRRRRAGTRLGSERTPSCPAGCSTQHQAPCRPHRPLLEVVDSAAIHGCRQKEGIDEQIIDREEPRQQLTWWAAGHGSQVTPSVEWRPSEQSTHCACRGSGALPGVHGVHTTPVAPMLPAAHGRHNARSGLEARPAAHATHWKAVLALLQHPPASRFSGDGSRRDRQREKHRGVGTSHLKNPSAHGMQWLCERSGSNPPAQGAQLAPPPDRVPAAQLMQLPRSAAGCFPCGHNAHACPAVLKPQHPRSRQPSWPPT